MSIILNDNIQINAGKPIDPRYLSTGNTAYSATTEVNITIPISQRYIGLTVNVNNVDYWYKEGVNDINLIEKKLNSVIDTTDLITGGTNTGYFSGRTGSQILPINHLTDDTYDGNYVSLYNYFYRDSTGVVRTGTPTDGIMKRGYLKSTGTPASWIWNEYSGGSDMVGWAILTGNVNALLGTFQNSISYYNGTTTFPYSATTWTEGSAYNNASDVVINTVVGNFTTGATVSIGGRPFNYSENNLLHFRTIKSDTPSTLNVRDDSSFIYISGGSNQYSGDNLGIVGIGVYSATSNNTHYFKRFVGSGDTVVSQIGDKVVVYSSSVSSEYPTLTAPSNGIAIIPSGSTFEVGCVIPTLCVTGTFNKGCINPQYPPTTCDKRSCNALSYCFDAPISTCYSAITDTYTHEISSYNVTEGVQNWGVCVNYDEGVQPYDSIGNFYCSPLSSGATSNAVTLFTGVLPWYYGLSTGGTVNGTCVAACGCGVGNKCVEVVNGSAIAMCFNSSASDYLWFAVPTGATAKTCWYVDGANNGCIGGVGNLFASACTVLVTSGEGCWSNCNYDVYVSCYQSGTETNTPMYMT